MGGNNSTERNYSREQSWNQPSYPQSPAAASESQGYDSYSGESYPPPPYSHPYAYNPPPPQGYPPVQQQPQPPPPRQQRRLDRRYSLIADNYISLNQVHVLDSRGWSTLTVLLKNILLLLFFFYLSFIVYFLFLPKSTRKYLCSLDNAIRVILQLHKDWWGNHELRYLNSWFWMKILSCPIEREKYEGYISLGSSKSIKHWKDADWKIKLLW